MIIPKCQEFMLDFETLGVKSDTIVISIGACFFDIETGAIGETFYRAISIESQIKEGRTFTAETIKWWMEQDNAAKKVFNEDGLPIRTVMIQFAEWIEKNKRGSIKPWGNGATFDISIAENLFDQFDIKIPWLFWDVNDLRTFKRFVAKDAKIEKIGVAHNALDDSLSQAKYVIKWTKK